MNDVLISCSLHLRCVITYIIPVIRQCEERVYIQCRKLIIKYQVPNFLSCSEFRKRVCTTVIQWRKRVSQYQKRVILCRKRVIEFIIRVIQCGTRRCTVWKKLFSAKNVQSNVGNVLYRVKYVSFGGEDLLSSTENVCYQVPEKCYAAAAENVISSAGCWKRVLLSSAKIVLSYVIVLSYFIQFQKQDMYILLFFAPFIIVTAPTKQAG